MKHNMRSELSEIRDEMKKINKYYKKDATKEELINYISSIRKRAVWAIQIYSKHKKKFGFQLKIIKKAYLFNNNAHEKHFKKSKQLDEVNKLIDHCIKDSEKRHKISNTNEIQGFGFNYEFAENHFNQLTLLPDEKNIDGYGEPKIKIYAEAAHKHTKEAVVSLKKAARAWIKIEEKVNKIKAAERELILKHIKRMDRKLKREGAEIVEEIDQDNRMY